MPLSWLGTLRSSNEGRGPATFIGSQGPRPPRRCGQVRCRLLRAVVVLQKCCVQVLERTEGGGAPGGGIMEVVAWQPNLLGRASTSAQEGDKPSVCRERRRHSGDLEPTTTVTVSVTFFMGAAKMKLAMRASVALCMLLMPAAAFTALAPGIASNRCLPIAVHRQCIWQVSEKNVLLACGWYASYVA